MSDDERPSLWDEDVVQRLLRTAQAAIADPIVSDQEKRLLRSCIRGLSLDCQIADEIDSQPLREVVIGLLEISNNILTHSQHAEVAKSSIDEAERRLLSRAGQQSAVTRKALAEKWQQHADDLIPEIEKDGPLSNAAMADELRHRWKLENPKAPSARHLARYLAGRMMT